jgi:hypothetical protein
MTGVIAFEIETGSAKISDQGVEDDEEDYEIPVWAGVLPLTLSTGSLIDDKRVLPGVVPSDAVKSMQNRKI